VVHVLTLQQWPDDHLADGPLSPVDDYLTEVRLNITVGCVWFVVVVDAVIVTVLWLLLLLLLSCVYYVNLDRLVHGLFCQPESDEQKDSNPGPQTGNSEQRPQTGRERVRYLTLSLSSRLVSSRLVSSRPPPPPVFCECGDEC
jgi:hypothetical protein